MGGFKRGGRIRVAEDNPEKGLEAMKKRRICIFMFRQPHRVTSGRRRRRRKRRRRRRKKKQKSQQQGSLQ